MENKYKHRNSDIIMYEKEDKFTCFLYQNKIGRCFLKFLYLPFVSKIAGLFMDSSLSKTMIKKFIIKNNIDMNDYEEEKYTSFNAFFTRKIKSGRRNISRDVSELVSPADSKLTVYKLGKDNSFKIKKSVYSLNELFDEDVRGFADGYALVFRLGVTDYHHYIFIDDGSFDGERVIKGRLHTVRPIAVDNENVFVQNSREVCILHTNNFGDVYMAEVGALMVGKIVNEKSSGRFKKGDEKGYFKFGGSTIILLLKDIEIDKDILDNSSLGIETIVKMGEVIGKRKRHD